MIYRLKYTDKGAAQADLLSRGVLQEVEGDLVKSDRTHAVVYVGQIVDVPAELNDEGEVITEATFVDGYHVDVMLKDEEDFGEYEVFPNTPSHNFAQ